MAFHDKHSASAVSILSLRIINKKLFDIQKTASAVALIEGRITLPYISVLKKAARTSSKPLFCHWFVTFQPINGIWNIIKHLKRYVFRRPHNDLGRQQTNNRQILLPYF
nr:MAG TPA: hypothetical protein [Caudoviricetes sp.]